VANILGNLDKVVEHPHSRMYDYALRRFGLAPTDERFLRLTEEQILWAWKCDQRLRAEVEADAQGRPVAQYADADFEAWERAVEAEERGQADERDRLLLEQDHWEEELTLGGH
jgi:hypothetical protein